jgi:hypothetical protein
MAILHFNEQWLIEKLEELPPSLRLLFATIAAQRLSPAYLNYSRLTGRGDPTALSNVLERLWRDTEGESTPSHPMLTVGADPAVRARHELNIVEF